MGHLPRLAEPRAHRLEPALERLQHGVAGDTDAARELDGACAYQWTPDLLRRSELLRSLLAYDKPLVLVIAGDSGCRLHDLPETHHTIVFANDGAPPDSSSSLWFPEGLEGLESLQDFPFWQPQAVQIDVNVLQSLPARDYHAGLAEVVKYGVIQDEDFFNRLENNVGLILDRDPEFMRDVIARCCELKAHVVENDERETTGLRAILNYGHTFCHAIEACTGYGTYMHGEAVSIGMLCASRLAESLGRITENDTARQRELLLQLNLPIDLPQDIEREPLVDAMKRDKKTEHGKIRFILPTRIGHVELVDGVDDALALAAFN